PFQWKLSNLIRVEDVAKRGILGVDETGLGAYTHLNYFGHRSDAQLHITLGLFSDWGSHIIQDRLLESLGFDLKPVIARRNQVEYVCTCIRRLHATLGIGRDVGERDLRSRHWSILRVGNGS